MRRRRIREGRLPTRGPTGRRCWTPCSCPRGRVWTQRSTRKRHAASWRICGAAAGTMPPKGNPRPRLYTPPLRELTPETSLGFECIEFAHDVVGVTLLPWEQEFLQGALELGEDGAYRFRTVLLLVARQAGKSTLAQVLILWKMFVGESKLTLGTAQNLDTAKEVWNGALDMIRGVPDLASQLGAVNNAGGRHEFAIVTGERYKIVSPSRGAGRGLSADLVIMDELREQKNWDTWASVSNTTMARPNAQIFAISNAGDASS